MPHLLALVLTLLLQNPADTVLVPALITTERQPVPFGKVASPIFSLSAATHYPTTFSGVLLEVE